MGSGGLGRLVRGSQLLFHGRVREPLVLDRNEVALAGHIAAPLEEGLELYRWLPP